MLNIYFFTSFGRLDQLPAGGGQTASRRLWHTLEKIGFNVEIFNRHRYYWYKGIIRTFLIKIWLILDPIWLFFKLLFRRRKDSAVLFMTYAGGLLPFDWAITMVASLSGHRLLMYLAGGQAKPVYEKGGRIYKWLFKHTMLHYDLILCEGEVTADLIKRSTDNVVKTFYLPNFTEDNFAPDCLIDKPTDKINIIYFGRICDNKKVLLGIDIFDQLCKKYNNLQYTIIGSGDLEYEKKVALRIESSPNKKRIFRYGLSPHDFILEKLKKTHFYLFPSCEPCEGHSNALNEAMSWGVVPVVSDNNFLPSIVGNNRLVAHELTTEVYTKIISDIIDSGDFEKLSKEMFDRVKKNFTQSVVEIKLKEALSDI